MGVVLSLSTQPFSTALISKTELPSLSAILRLFYFHQVNQRRNNEYSYSHELDPHKNTQWAKLEIQQTPAEDSQKHRFSIQKQIEGFLLMLIEAIKPENSTRQFFSTRVCESSTHDLCVLPLQICKVKCDWLLSADVTEIILVARVRRRYFWRR